MAPSVLVGALLSVLLHRAGNDNLLPAVWLLLYGMGVSSAGAFSVRVVPAMGMSFMALGALAGIAPASWADALLALGFGGIHIVFGFIIARDHSG